MGAGFEHLADEHGVFVAGEDQDADVFKLFGKTAEEIYAVEAGEFGVEHQEVGLHIKTEGEGALTVTAFADQFIVGVEPEDFHKHFADGGLIFYNN
jgi:hypothetical protein